MKMYRLWQSAHFQVKYPFKESFEKAPYPS